MPGQGTALCKQLPAAAARCCCVWLGTSRLRAWTPPQSECPQCAVAGERGISVCSGFLRCQCWIFPRFSMRCFATKEGLTRTLPARVIFPSLHRVHSPERVSHEQGLLDNLSSAGGLWEPRPRRSDRWSPCCIRSVSAGGCCAAQTRPTEAHSMPMQSTADVSERRAEIPEKSSFASFSTTGTLWDSVIHGILRTAAAGASERRVAAER